MNAFRRILFLLLIAVCAGATAVAQNYRIVQQTGTETAYDVNAEGTVILAVPSAETLSDWRPLPFPWKFYDRTVNGYHASDNGYITFDEQAEISVADNAGAPAPEQPNDAIFAFWDDLTIDKDDPSRNHHVKTWTYGAEPRRVHVIQWTAGNALNEAARIIAAIRIYECGDFDIVLSESFNFSSPDFSATIGCEDASGARGAFVDGAPEIPEPRNEAGNDDDIVYAFLWDGLSYDVEIIGSAVDGFLLRGANRIKGTLLNRGVEPIASFDLHYAVDGEPTRTMRVDNIALAQGAAFDFVHDQPFTIEEADRNYEICVWADNLNSARPDERPCNNRFCFTDFAQAGAGRKKLLVEEFSGAWCSGCPDAQVTIEALLEEYGEDAVVISIHEMDAMEFDDGIRTAFEVARFPTALIDRTMFGDNINEVADQFEWEEAAAVQMQTYTPLDVTLEHTYDAGSRNITVTVGAEFAGAAAGDMRFVCAIAEDTVRGAGEGYDQRNAFNEIDGHPYAGMGDPIIGYPHRHVLRALPSGAFGVAGSIPQVVEAGASYSETFSYTLPPDVDAHEVTLVGYVVRYSEELGARSVMNVNQQRLDFQTSVRENRSVPSLSVSAYPTPAPDAVTLTLDIGAAAHMRIDLHDTRGVYIGRLVERVFEAGREELNIDVGAYTPGAYFVVVRTDAGSITTSFVVVR